MLALLCEEKSNKQRKAGLLAGGETDAQARCSARAVFWSFLTAPPLVFEWMHGSPPRGQVMTPHCLSLAARLEHSHAEFTLTSYYKYYYKCTKFASAFTFAERNYIQSKLSNQVADA